MSLSLRFGILCFLLFVVQYAFGQSQKAKLNMEKIEQNAWKKDLSDYQSHQEFFQK